MVPLHWKVCLDHLILKLLSLTIIMCNLLIKCIKYCMESYVDYFSLLIRARIF